MYDDTYYGRKAPGIGRVTDDNKLLKELGAFFYRTQGRCQSSPLSIKPYVRYTFPVLPDVS